MSGYTVACNGCDLLQRVPPLVAGAKARCPRCGGIVAWHPRHGADHGLALALTCAIAIVLANALPLMSMSAAGHEATTTLVGGVVRMWQHDSELTAVVVAFCAIVAPAIYVGAMLAVLVAARQEAVPRWAGELLEWAGRVKPWAMVEVLLLGILVALVKIAQLATVTPGGGMVALGALVFLLPWFVSTVDSDGLWARVPWLGAR